MGRDAAAHRAARAADVAAAAAVESLPARYARLGRLLEKWEALANPVTWAAIRRTVPQIAGRAHAANIATV